MSILKHIKKNKMPRTTDDSFLEQLDKIGLRITKYLEKERRTKEWFAKKVKISSVALRYKMKDDSKWSRWEMVRIAKILDIKLRL